MNGATNHPYTSVSTPNDSKKRIRNGKHWYILFLSSLEDYGTLPDLVDRTESQILRGPCLSHGRYDLTHTHPTPVRFRPANLLARTGMRTGTPP